MNFISGLELSRLLYEEEIKPLMDREFLGLKSAVATLGMCSEIFGLDDEISMDHEWGPRLTVFLSEEDHQRYSTELMASFQKSLPTNFKGFKMMWRNSGVSVHNTREAILYHVSVGTVANTLKFYGGIQTLPLDEVDWLKISEQHLLEFTSGVVYADGLGELTRAREMLKYYPDNVLRFLLKREWEALGSDWFPIGRIGARGDQLGLRIQAAKVTNRLMCIAFMVSRKYIHYKKWFGTLFKQLPISSVLEPVLLELVGETDWQKVESKIGQAAAILIHAQNNLGIIPKLDLTLGHSSDPRHHLKVDFWQVGNELASGIQRPLKSLMQNEVFWLDERSLILWNEEIGKWSLLLQK